MTTEANEPALTIHAAGDTWIGTRPHNEDTYVLRPDLGLYVLADGAGGENAGNVASALATAAIVHGFEQTQHQGDEDFDDLGLPVGSRRLSSAVHRANREILEIAKTSDRHNGMGTTVVAAYFERARPVVHIAHVGDSRCYRLRGSRLELLTHDHTLVNDVLELQPDLPHGKAKNLPRHVITRALGMTVKLRVAVRVHEVLSGDMFLMCSDGLTDEVEESAIADALRLAQTPDEQVRLLVDLAKDAEASDNVAAVVLHTEMSARAAARASTRTRTRPTRRATEAQLAQLDDEPEIVVIGPEGTSEDSQPAIHVVPRAPVSPEIVNAVDPYFTPGPPPVPRRRDETTVHELVGDEIEIE